TLIRYASAVRTRVGKLGLIQRENRAYTAWQIIWWWEQRRMASNLIVGATGVVTCMIMLATGTFAERCVGDPIGAPDPFFGPFQAICYGIAANVAYTGGWFMELQARERWGAREDFGPIALVLGLLFSIALTL